MRGKEVHFLKLEQYKAQFWNNQQVKSLKTPYLKGFMIEGVQYNILLHLFKPDYYSSIASFNHKEKIVDFFSTQLKMEFDKTDDLDDKFFKVKDKCWEKYGDNYPYKWDTIYHEYEFNKLDFYHPNIEKFWKSNIVLESKNMILHGAPLS